jgi:serine/threonine protein kinase
VGEEPPQRRTSLLTGLEPGSRIAGYRLEEQIGAGGMAVVFRARDERRGRLVALKIMTPALAADERFRERFAREAQAAAAVDDPHILPFYEAGEFEGLLYMAIWLVRGGDVKSLLTRAGPLPPARVASIISPVASALDAAHAAGLVHRDVKPANMLLDSYPGRPDHVYLSDFGLSKAAQATGLTGSGQFVGTPDYTAPEQIAGRAVDGRADQYGLACAAFELLTGTVPFHLSEGVAAIYAHLSKPPPALTSLRPDLATAADPVLARALAKSPGDRYPDCREFADALRHALGAGRYHMNADLALAGVAAAGVAVGDLGLDDLRPAGLPSGSLADYGLSTADLSTAGPSVIRLPRRSAPVARPTESRSGGTRSVPGTPRASRRRARQRRRAAVTLAILLAVTAAVVLAVLAAS